jgi:glutathione S-transferase
MRLTYFAARGRVEPTLLMLEMAGARYELEPMPLDTWMGPEGKHVMLERTPFGQLPLFQDGDLVLCQSRAIHRYVARKLGFYGETLAETARIDEVAETADEMYQDIAMLCWDPQFQQHRAEHHDAMLAKLEYLQRYFARTRADAEHWVVPGRYTLADAAMAYALESLLPLHAGLVQEFPDLLHVMTAFFASDRVREYARSERRFRIFTVSLAPFGGKPEETHHWTD